jgi:hypothetical protein
MISRTTQSWPDGVAIELDTVTYYDDCDPLDKDFVDWANYRGYTGAEIQQDPKLWGRLEKEYQEWKERKQ